MKREEADRDSLEPLLAPLRDRSSWVLGQLGQSLDGRIATESGHSRYISGPLDLTRLHALRALADAVIVGAGTVAADDPQLTVRMVEGPNPVRVILDPSARLGSDYRLFQDHSAATLHLVARKRRSATSSDGECDAQSYVASHAESNATSAPEEETVSASTPVEPNTTGELDTKPEAVVLETNAARQFDPHRVLQLLRQRGLQRILVEGGGITVSRFLQAGALDRLHICVAPLLIGSGRPGITLPPIQSLDQALRPSVQHHRLGEDLLFDLVLSD